jgi:hypothetical protein
MSSAVFDYNKVDTVSKQLQNANTELVGRLTDLQNTVTAMLSSGGGLYMEQSSPALHDAYAHFTVTLQNAMNNIGNFATQFDKIKQGLLDFDGSTQKQVIAAGQKQ